MNKWSPLRLVRIFAPRLQFSLCQCICFLFWSHTWCKHSWIRGVLLDEQRISFHCWILCPAVTFLYNPLCMYYWWNELSKQNHGEHRTFGEIPYILAYKPDNFWPSFDVQVVGVGLYAAHAILPARISIQHQGYLSATLCVAARGMDH